jgi:putative DNA primase/helicase
MAINVDGIPDELKKLNQWVGWSRGIVDGKETKIPYIANKKPSEATKASVDNSETWSSYGIALVSEKIHEGIGFVFTEQDQYCGIDFDKCIDPDTKIIEGWVSEKLQKLNSYTEGSQGGLGLHVILKGKIPEHIKAGNKTGRKDKKTGIEIYDCGRYFCMTGNIINGYSVSIEERQAEFEQFCNDIFGKPEPEQKPSRQEPSTSNLSDSEIINIIRKSKQSNKFSKLFDHGDCSDYLKADGTPDQSSGDMALVDIIAFYTQDFQQILSITKQSALYDDKWEREDYQHRTIEKALSWSVDRYSPGGNHTSNDKSNKADNVTFKAHIRQSLKVY